MFTLVFGTYSFPNLTFELKSLPAENNIDESRIPRRHGSLIATPYLKTRKFRVNGKLYNSTNTTTESQLMDMQACLFGLGKQHFQYRSDRYIDCIVKVINPEFEKGTDKAVTEVDIDLLASDPFFVASGASVTDVQNHTGGTINFDITASGNAFNEPRFYICATAGTILDDISLTSNTDSSKNCKYRGTIANGQTLLLDSSAFSVLNNSADGMTDFEGNFLNLLAGVNSLTYSGMTCRLTTEYKGRWY